MMKESAGKIGMNKTYEVKTANGGSYIDGVPMLKWGEWRDCTYGGTLALIFDVIGIETSYEEIMGLSGSCYKIIMADNWDPGSEMPQVGVNCEYNAPKALGIDVYCIADDRERNINAMKNIDTGFPMLACGQRYAPEWTVITGYQKQAGTVKFFGRTYFDCGTEEYNYPRPKEDEIFTDNQYYHANQYPGEYPGALLRFFNRRCDRIDFKSALKISLETCVQMFEQSPSHYKYGYDAYDVLIAGFEMDDEQYQKQCTNDQYHIGSLQDARRAAYLFLDKSADYLAGNNKAKLKKAANLYKMMLDNMINIIPYEKTSSVFNRSSKPVWNMELRRDLANTLRVNKELERQVQTIVKEILD